MKAVKILLVVLAGVGITGAAGFYFFFRAAVPEYNGTIHLKGLKEEVEVRTDDHGVPHIFAQNREDLYFAQGYIVARERMFQMDMTRLAGRGELSSVFGERTLEKDRFLKTVGFYRHAVKSYPSLLPETREAIEAFTRGVNKYLDTVEVLPREYFFLKTRPRPWAPEDSVACAMLMSYSLTRSKKVDLLMTKLLDQAGPELFEMILPSYPDFAPTLTGKGTGQASGDLTWTGKAAAGTGTMDLDFPYPMDIAASNWMLFSGAMTQSGKALFAGSPDLSPTLPALFYLMRLKGGDIDAAGGVLPGVPGMGPLGFNGHFAYSAVNGRGDELDYFIEKINPDNPDQYLTEDGYRDFRIIEETLHVKSGDKIDTRPLKVRISRHGPMISDVLPDAPAGCAMQWSALDLPAGDIDGLIQLTRAENFDQFRKALSRVRTINLNIGYADREGNIGWQFTAAPPLRKSGKGSVARPGWTGEYDWTGFVPFEDLPFDYNPGSGYVASFNNDPGGVSYHLTNFYLFERAIRFKEIMEKQADKPIDFHRLRELQLDTGSTVAQRWAPMVVAACRKDPDLAPAVKLLSGWDYKIETDSSAATLFNYFYLEMTGETLVDEVGEELWKKGLRREYLYYIPDLLLSRIAMETDHPLYDDRRTPQLKENRDDIIRRAAGKTLDFLSAGHGDAPGDWQWGQVHQMAFDHPLGGKLPFLNLDPVPTHGSHHTINSGFWNPDKPFSMSSGGVIRMMVDFSDIERSTFISPPGQSGHYLSPFYDDLAETWASGGQIPMHFLTGRDLPNLLALLP
ncbi:MAG: penicillin acylase family protein [Desulfobacterales bacterium]|nr:penicillin acylase family protein [Desulfobacterales bacterium]